MSRETVRETVFRWKTPFDWALRSSRSARASFSPASASALPDSTARTALRAVERMCLFRACRFSDWRWRFLAEA